MNALHTYSTDQLQFMHAKVFLAAVELAEKAAKKRVALAKKVARQTAKTKRASELRKQLEMAQRMLAALQVGATTPELLATAQLQVEQCRIAYQHYLVQHKLLTPEAQYLEQLSIKDLEQQQATRQQEAEQIAAILHARN